MIINVIISDSSIKLTNQTENYILMKTVFYINCRGKLLEITTPIVMGIINLTDNSFYAGSRYNTEKEILNRVETIINEGGKIVEIGACSTRPGVVLENSQQEIDKIVSALNIIRKHFPNISIAVDTFRSEVAQKAIIEGEADIINDISGGELDNKMFDTIANLNVPYILTHIKGTPQTMQQNPHYENLIGEIMIDLAQKVDILRKKGVNDIIIDPGFGFGKTLDQNYELLKNLKQFRIFGLPIMVGISRKTMIYNFLNIKPEDALNGTTILNCIALLKGANILRVHDVKEAVETINLIQKLTS